MKTIAISVQKGGSGKTTTAANLAAAIAARGKRVLLIDNDPQSSLTLYCNLSQEKTITDVYHGNAAIQEIVQDWNGIDVVPADILLSQVENEIAERKDRRNILHSALAKASQYYDCCVIDTAPGLGLLTVNALMASDHVIIPMEPNPADIWGLELFLSTLNRIRKAKPGLTYKILLTSYNDRLKLHQTAKEAVERRNLDLYPVTIARNVRTAEAWGAHKPLLAYDPGNKNNIAYKTIAEMEMHE
ncbi:MAG: ParA family protein [Flexilinea sp.]|nr:ParA family protein [Flexilinea sp.]